MNLRQAEALLQEASMEYIRHGVNKDEVEYYAKLVLELNKKETTDFLQGE